MKKILKLKRNKTSQYFMGLDQEENVHHFKRTIFHDNMHTGVYWTESNEYDGKIWTPVDSELSKELEELCIRDGLRQ